MHFWSHFHLCVCLCLMKKMKRPVDLMNFAVRITTASRTTGDVTARMTAETTPMRSIAVSRSHLSEHNKAFSTLVFVLNCFNCQTLGGLFRGQFRRLFEDFFLSVCLPFICSLLILPTLPQRKINYLCVFYAMSFFTCIPNPYVLSIWLFLVIVVCQTSKKTKNKSRRKKSVIWQPMVTRNWRKFPICKCSLKLFF